ncbi:MAG TPA: ATP-binding protein, partial [Burkholderiaceae bacterium]|nr:ATP-binding protein [Burkholderiaceae bacterium]
MKRLRSLRWRLLLATLAAGLLALALAGVLLAGLFRDQVMRQFGLALTAQLDQVTAALEIDARGEAHIDATALTDPRWQRPLSGLYWQVDRRRADGSWQRGLLRSRSLWDAELQAPLDALADGSVHLHEAAGPAGARLLLAERSLHVGASG